MELTLDFDKEDVAAIAIAEAELKMRRTMKELKDAIVATDTQIDDTKDKFTKIGEDLVNQKVLTRFKIIEKAIKATKIKELKVEFNSNINFDSYKPNNYSIVIRFQERNNICVKTENFETTAAQKLLIIKAKNLEDKKTGLINDTINWRKKLADMPMLERQVKAALAKRQVEKMSGGKEMVKALINNFDNTVKLLGE